MRKPEVLVDNTHRRNGDRYGRCICVIIICTRFVIPCSPLIYALDIEVALGNCIRVRKKFYSNVLMCVQS